MNSCDSVPTPYAEAIASLRAARRATIPTGVTTIDTVARGLGPGELWVATSDRYSVAQLVARLATRVAGQGEKVSFCSGEKTTEELWTTLLAVWTWIRPARLGSSNLTMSERRRLDWVTQTDPDRYLFVAGVDRDWSVEQAIRGARLLVIDGPFDDLSPQDLRSYARDNRSTVLVGAYDRKDDRWKRYADTWIRFAAPRDEIEDPRAGQIDFRLTSSKHQLRADGTLFDNPIAWVDTADGLITLCDTGIFSPSRRDFGIATSRRSSAIRMRTRAEIEHTAPGTDLVLVAKIQETVFTTYTDGRDVIDVDFDNEPLSLRQVSRAQWRGATRAHTGSRIEITGTVADRTTLSVDVVLLEVLD